MLDFYFKQISFAGEIEFSSTGDNNNGLDDFSITNKSNKQKDHVELFPVLVGSLPADREVEFRKECTFESNLSPLPLQNFDR